VVWQQVPAGAGCAASTVQISSLALHTSDGLVHSPFSQLWPAAQQLWRQQTFEEHWLFAVQPVQLPLRQVALPQQSQLPRQAPPGSRQQR
jgi:hypothetical protein